MGRTLAPTSARPPGPRTPAWGQLVRFAGAPLGLLDECHRRFGDAFTLHVAGNGHFVMLSDPEAVREVFRGDPDVLHSGEANSLFTATVGRHSVLVLDGQPHARQRRVVVAPLNGERMRAFFDARRRGTPAPPGQSVLEGLLAAAHEDGTPLGEREVRDALITILIAGHDTTALALAWAMSDIAGHPEVVDRLADELNRVTGGGP